MVVIRLARTGSKKNPFYHIVVADKRTSRDGRFIERIGYFDPMARGKAARLQLDKERITYWQSNGAQPSPRVSHLLKESEELAEKEPTAKLTRAQARKEQSENSAKAAAKAKKAAEEKMKAEAEAAAKEAASEASAEEEAPEAKTEAKAQPEAKEKSSEEKAE